MKPHYINPHVEALRKRVQAKFFFFGPESVDHVMKSAEISFAMCEAKTRQEFLDTLTCGEQALIGEKGMEVLQSWAKE